MAGNLRMPQLNVTYAVGRLTRNPELRHTPSGTAVCNFDIAVDSYFSANGEMKKETVFYKCVAWGNVAEAVHKNTEKGKAVMVEGRFYEEAWQTKDGQDRKALKLRCNRVQALEWSNEQSSGDDYGNESQSRRGNDDDEFDGEMPF